MGRHLRHHQIELHLLHSLPDRQLEVLALAQGNEGRSEEEVELGPATVPLGLVDEQPHCGVLDADLHVEDDLLDQLAEEVHGVAVDEFGPAGLGSLLLAFAHGLAEVVLEVAVRLQVQVQSLQHQLHTPRRQLRVVGHHHTQLARRPRVQDVRTRQQVLPVDLLDVERDAFQQQFAVLEVLNRHLLRQQLVQRPVQHVLDEVAHRTEVGQSAQHLPQNTTEVHQYYIFPLATPHHTPPPPTPPQPCSPIPKSQDCFQVEKVVEDGKQGGVTYGNTEIVIDMMIGENESGNKRVLGKVNAGVVVAAYVPLIILTPFYCYHMAVKQGQEKPYPAATITSTACHYPQDIAFRYFMLIASSLLALIFFLIFRWCAAVVKQAGYPQKLPSYLYYVTQFSILLYGITIGTIDSRGTGPLHSPCAVAFFLILIIAIIRVTIFLTDLRAYDTTVMTKQSLRLKQLLALYLLLLWIYCVAMLIAVSSQELESKGDKYVVIVEWNTVTMGLLWVLAFFPEWKHLALALTTPDRP